MTKAEKALLDLVLSADDERLSPRERSNRVQVAKYEVLSERCSSDVIDMVRRQMLENYESNQRWRETQRRMEAAGFGLMFFGEHGLVAKWWVEADAERKAKAQP